ncbi:MAG: aminoacyl-tRNA hydrolase [Proteobacteria bacterium]|nr:aminoacyl-tRNA hydrolase [Pseudomonadota bacterium]
MLLCVGLGNPGQQYLMTRHNIGFMVVDAVSLNYNFPIFRKKFQSEFSERKIRDVNIGLIKPQTFMNLSGVSVQSAMAFYKLKPEQIIVIHDDLDLIPGQIKVKFGGGSGGHNGLKSIDQAIGNGYWRLRLGIGHPGVKHLVAPHVLSPFLPADHEWLKILLQKIAQEFEHLASESPDVWGRRLTI